MELSDSSEDIPSGRFGSSAVNDQFTGTAAANTNWVDLRPLEVLL